MLVAIGRLRARGRAAPAGPKVVIIVGATHGATRRTARRPNAAYAEASKYTSNVVKVYSPNATWAKVKAAVEGASIVIYMGHGNGWPSPYTYDPKYTTKDGFGLNATAGRRRQQQQVLRRAVRRDARPRAERDRPAPPPVLRVGQLRARATRQPSVTTARKRARQLRRRVPQGGRAGRHRRRARGRRALPAGAVHDPPVDRGGVADAPNFNDHVERFASTRTAGATAYTDPEARVERLLPLARRATRPDDRRGHRCHVRRHRRRPDHPRRAGQRRGRGSRRRPL